MPARGDRNAVSGRRNARPIPADAGRTGEPTVTVVRPSPGNSVSLPDVRRPLDRAAVDAWVRSTLPRAIAFASGLLRHDRECAEDIVHDCYCRLLAKADEYNLPEDGIRLLFRAITNACIDRSRRRKPISLSAFAGNEDDDLSYEPADVRTPEPWANATHAELRQAVQSALDELPPVQRAAIELRSLGQSLDDIGIALGVTANHAGVLVHRARQAMQRRMGLMDTDGQKTV